MTQDKSPYMKAMSILHYALLMGQVLMAAILITVVYIGKSNSFKLQNIAQHLLIASILIAAACYFGANIFFRKKLENIRNSTTSVTEKLEGYRAASIGRWGIMEFATLLCIILFFTTGDIWILIVAGIMMILFFSTRPGTAKTVADLNINESELENAS